MKLFKKYNYNTSSNRYWFITIVNTYLLLNFFLPVGGCLFIHSNWMKFQQLST